MVDVRVEGDVRIVSESGESSRSQRSRFEPLPPSRPSSQMSIKLNSHEDSGTSESEYRAQKRRKCKSSSRRNAPTRVPPPTTPHDQRLSYEPQKPKTNRDDKKKNDADAVYLSSHLRLNPNLDFLNAIAQRRCLLIEKDDLLLLQGDSRLPIKLVDDKLKAWENRLLPPDGSRSALDEVLRDTNRKGKRNVSRRALASPPSSSS